MTSIRLGIVTSCLWLTACANSQQDEGILAKPASDLTPDERVQFCEEIRDWAEQRYAEDDA